MTILDLKLLFFRSMVKWMTVSGLFSFSNLLDLIIFVTLEFNCGCTYCILLVYLGYIPCYLYIKKEFENRSTINLLHVYFEFEFLININDCSNPLI